MTKIWAIEMQSKSYRVYDSKLRIIRGAMTVRDKYWLVKCPCQEKLLVYQTLVIHPDLDHCPECKAGGQISEEPWFGDVDVEESTQGTPA